MCVTNVRLLMLTLMLFHVFFHVFSPLCVRASLEFPSCLCIHAMHAHILLRLPCYAHLAMNSLFIFATLAVHRSSSTILSVRAIGTFAISVLKVSSDVYGDTSWIGGVSIQIFAGAATLAPHSALRFRATMKEFKKQKLGKRHLMIESRQLSLTPSLGTTHGLRGGFNSQLESTAAVTHDSDTINGVRTRSDTLVQPFLRSLATPG